MSRRHRDDGREPDRLTQLYAAIADACPSGKIKIKKLAEAQSEASHLNKRRPFQGPPLIVSAYRCNICGYWHVGRSNKPRADHG